LKSTLLSIFARATIILILISCQTNKLEIFPYTEKQMVENSLFGTLLEYAIFDSTKCEFVKTIICDSLKKEYDFVFSKMHVEINDTSYHQFIGPYEEDWNVIYDYYGVIYIDINRRDSFCVYNYDLVYGFDDLDLIIEKIASRYNKSPIEILKNRKVGNAYIPEIYFVVETATMNCEEGFVEKVISVNKFINDLMNSYSSRKLPMEEIRITPYIKIRKYFSCNDYK